MPAGNTAAIGTLPQPTRRDFSGVGYEEAMRRAREIVPILRERAQQAEDARVSDPRHRAAAARDGAVPLPPAEGVRRHGARLRGGGRHPGGDRARLRIDGLERRQPRLPPLDTRLLRPRDPARGVGRQPGCADRLVDRAGCRARAQGRRRIHRQRPLAVLLRRRQLGLEHAGRHRLGDDGKTAVDWRLCLVPKSDYEIIDTWYAMGMAATGSKDVAVKELFVPERRALALQRCRGGLEHPGAALNAGPLFRIPIVAASSHPMAPSAVGAAEGAYELFVASMAKRAGTYTGAKVADFQAVQIKLARARCLIDSARHLLRQSAIELQAAAERNEVPDLATKLRYRAQSAFAVEPGARGGGGAVVVLRRAGHLHARSVAAASARRDGHHPALLVQLRHRRLRLRPRRAGRRVCQSDDVRGRSGLTLLQAPIRRY